jgi:hypothetical protein
MIEPHSSPETKSAVGTHRTETPSLAAAPVGSPDKAPPVMLAPLEDPSPAVMDWHVAVVAPLVVEEQLPITMAPAVGDGGR